MQHQEDLRSVMPRRQLRKNTFTYEMDRHCFVIEQVKYLLEELSYGRLSIAT